MKKILLAALCASLLLPASALAQDDLFQTAKADGRQGMVIGINANFDAPAADMAKRFGLGYRVGPSLHFKTSGNWLIGAKYDFLLGNKIVEPGLLQNVMTEDRMAYNVDGELIKVIIQKRGFMAGFYLAKVLDLGKNPDNGLVVQLGLGFMQHRIHFKAQDDEVPQIVKPYNKWYDRLTNGFYAEPFVGYQYMDPNGMLSFYVGANATMGFTKGRRDFLYDVQQPGTDARKDVLFGLRGGLYIPMFRKKADDIFY